MREFLFAMTQFQALAARCACSRAWRRSGGRADWTTRPRSTRRRRRKNAPMPRSASASDFIELQSSNMLTVTSGRPRHR